MSKIKIGDTFSITTPKGSAYIQYVFQDNQKIELIRVLKGLYPEKPSNLNSIVEAKELFLIHFPLSAAYKKKIVKLEGNYALPKNFELPNRMRTKKVDNAGNFINWQIIDYKTWNRENFYKLTEEQKQLSPWGIWNDTLLIERLSEGWTLEKWE